MDWQHKSLEDLMTDAVALHSAQREMTIQSTYLVAELDRRRAAGRLGLSYEEYAKALGLTKDQLTKRMQAARVMRRFPEAKGMLDAGETEISCLAVMAAKLTPANKDLVFGLVKGKSKSEVVKIMARVTPDGQLLEEHEVIEIRVTLTVDEAKLLERAREVLAAGGHVPSQSEIVVKALRDLLARRDPMVAAKKAMAKAEAKRAKAEAEAEAKAKARDTEASAKAEAKAGAEGGVNDDAKVSADAGVNASTDNGAQVDRNTGYKRQSQAKDPAEGAAGFSSGAPGQQSGVEEFEEFAEVDLGQHCDRDFSCDDAALSFGAPGQWNRASARSKIPAHVRHEVWIRDEGRCTKRLANGERCPETIMVEFEHLIMKCRGGDDTAKNVTLRCRYHNIYSAEVNLGRSWREDHPPH